MLQALHVGDSLEVDIQGGANAGLAATVWVNRNGLALPTEAPIPTHTVAHVSELGVLLEQMRCLQTQRTSFEGYGFAMPEVQEAVGS